MGETLFLVNPASGNGAAGRKWPEIERAAAEAGLRGEPFVSRGRSEIERRAREAADAGVERLVVVGGDGTVNEVLNGILPTEGSTPELAVIMVGTAKDFAHSHGIPTDVPRAIEVAARGKTAIVDVGRVRHRSDDGGERERYFGNVASAGMGGAVARRTDETSKALGGKVSYFIALVRVFARWQNAEMTVEAGDERRQGRMTSVIVANGAYHAGSMWLAPGARIDDGLLDVVVFGDISKFDFVTSVGRIYRGTHLTHPKIELLRAAAVTIESAEPQPLELDGEQPGTTPARFEVVPGALRLRVP